MHGKPVIVAGYCEREIVLAVSSGSEYKRLGAMVAGKPRWHQYKIVIPMVVQTRSRTVDNDARKYADPVTGIKDCVSLEGKERRASITRLTPGLGLPTPPSLLA